MNRPTRILIAIALTVCLASIAAGFYFFKWQGSDYEFDPKHVITPG
jgi:hypothetical protein